MNKKNIVVVGATGMVGREIIRCLAMTKFPVGDLKLTASANSVGQTMDTPFGQFPLEELSSQVFSHADIALFAAGSEVSETWAAEAVNQNCLVIDNSSYFRYQNSVPLIIPEINGQEAFKNHGIIANPNCTTAIAAIPLWVIQQNFGIKKVLISTYQAVSGAGKAGMSELAEQVQQASHSVQPMPKAFSRQILHNLIPQIDVFQENGYTKEEMKVVWELRKIFSLPELAVSCTAVRVPVMRAHSESLVVETEKQIAPAEYRELLRHTTGVEVVDEPEKLIYPSPLTASEKEAVEIGRIRQSLIFGGRGIEFFVSGDQLWRGAALNAVKIAQLFI